MPAQFSHPPNKFPVQLGPQGGSNDIATLNQPLSTAKMMTVLPNVPLTPPGLPPKPARKPAVASTISTTAHQTVSPPPIQQSQSSSSSTSAVSFPSEDVAIKLPVAPRVTPPSPARARGRPRGKHVPTRGVRKIQSVPHVQPQDSIPLDYSVFEQHNSLVRSHMSSPEPTSICVKVPPPAPCQSPRVETPHSAHLPPQPEQQLPPRGRRGETCDHWLMGRCTKSPCRYLHELQPGACLVWLRMGRCNKYICPFQHAQPTFPCEAWLKGSCNNSPCPFLHERKPETSVDVSEDACKEPSSCSSEKKTSLSIDWLMTHCTISNTPSKPTEVARESLTTPAEPRESSVVPRPSPQQAKGTLDGHRESPANSNSRPNGASSHVNRDCRITPVEPVKSGSALPRPSLQQAKGTPDGHGGSPANSHSRPNGVSSSVVQECRTIPAEPSKSSATSRPSPQQAKSTPDRHAESPANGHSRPNGASSHVAEECRTSPAEPRNRHSCANGAASHVTQGCRISPIEPVKSSALSRPSIQQAKGALDGHSGSPANGHSRPNGVSSHVAQECRTTTSEPRKGSAISRPSPQHTKGMLDSHSESPANGHSRPNGVPPHVGQECRATPAEPRKSSVIPRQSLQQAKGTPDGHGESPANGYPRPSGAPSSHPPPVHARISAQPSTFDNPKLNGCSNGTVPPTLDSRSVPPRTSDVNIRPPRIPVQERLPETCLDWPQGTCRRSPCPYLHSRQPETCAKWRQDICQRFFCPFVHDLDVTCRDWLRGQCNWRVCRYAHAKALDKPAPSLEPLFGTVIADHIKVRLDRGFEVQEVVTGFESRWVHLGNVAPGISSNVIRGLLSQYGHVDSLIVPESTTKKSFVVKAQFSSPAEAMKAATALHGQEFHDQHLTARLSINNFKKGNMVVTDTDVCVTWQSPHRMGYGGYATLKGARAVMDSVSNTRMGDSLVTADLYDGLPAVGAYNVVFRHLPSETTEQDIRNLGGDVESIMLERPNYTSIERAMQTLRSILENYGTVISFDDLPPPYRDGAVKAWVRFSSHAEARHAQDSLDGQNFAFLGRTPISVRHVLSMSYTLPCTIYRKLQDDLTWLRRSWSQRYGPGITLSEKGDINGMADGPVFIRVSCEDSLLLSHLKYEFEQLLRGDTVMFNKKPIWDDFLTGPTGLSFIHQLQREYPGVEVQVRGSSRIVTVMGTITRRHLVKQEIVRKIVEVQSQLLWDIPLPGRTLGLFLSEDLTRLQETFGAENCYLHYGKRALIVRGNEQTFRIACKAVQDAQSRQGVEPSQSGAICPVCFNDPVLPTFLPCGHQWCRGCLVGYLSSAVDNKTFPLTCLGNEACCSERIPLSLARELLTAAEFDAVVDAAFWTHVHSRPDEFHHCPVPDCIQIYRSAPRNTVLQCPSCLTHICPACHIEYHDGMTCEERDAADDKLFWQWRSDNDVKDCPVCRVPIERSEGCNHMTCIRCQSHICWECLAVFPRGEGIYDHMRNKHGGIGL
ncbi:hypothetical protein BKA82DRAFT_532707 [Pisolithus tinctorius]|uniref:RBR-type E3 ubiquitin transferase n=1 Tax=Pisolithus tinctorius Marx 270 TaxID=870435 RepID=A0A0C3PAW6_PISTI|nr:hypothetical protein BKA82DRAFT_532707 [Pisolithus tinctorius]KIO05071.1 hypothetical protein M404DRAFT_532707 [Pisolithus tinctorius Marx 270]